MIDSVSLLREISRVSEANIEPYNDAYVRQNLQNLTRNYHEASLLTKTSSVSKFASSDDFKLLLTQCDIVRSKRCLLAYHKARLEHLSKLALELPTFPANIRNQLSNSENHFQMEYSASLIKISAAYSNLLSITGPLSPPKDLYICVRVAKDCGVVQTEFGPLYLDQNSFHYLRKSDVEHLISQGYLVHVN